MTKESVAILNTTRNTVLGERIWVAETSLSRMVGLLGKKGLDPGTGLLIVPSQAVHTVGMRFTIDVVFIDRKWKVIHLRPEMVPYRLTSIHWRARCVLELPAGAIAKSSTVVGDDLSIEN